MNPRRLIIYDGESFIVDLCNGISVEQGQPMSSLEYFFIKYLEYVSLKILNEINPRPLAF